MKFRHALILVIARILGLKCRKGPYGHHFIYLGPSFETWSDICIEEL